MRWWWWSNTRIWDEPAQIVSMWQNILVILSRIVDSTYTHALSLSLSLESYGHAFIIALAHVLLLCSSPDHNRTSMMDDDGEIKKTKIKWCNLWEGTHRGRRDASVLSACMITLNLSLSTFYILSPLPLCHCHFNCFLDIFNWNFNIINKSW